MENGTDDLAQHYARILDRQTDRRVSAVIRACLHRLPQRLSLQPRDRQAAQTLIDRVLRLGEVGAPDIIGSPRSIDGDIARALGDEPGDPRTVYRALHALHGRTVLVERLSRQIWALRLSGLTDPSSALHRALLVETPSLYSLPPPAQDDAATTGVQVDVTASLGVDTVDDVERLQRGVAEEHAQRVAAERQRAAAEVELERLHLALAEVERERDAISRQLEAEQARRVEAEQRAVTDRRDAQAEADRLARQREEDALMALAKTRQELDALRQSQAEDLSRVRELVEQNQIPEAITFFAAHVMGAGVDDANRIIDRLAQNPGQPSRQGPIMVAMNPPPYISSLTPKVVEDEQRSGSGRIGRNTPCPCGSGKKYKRCCSSAE